MLFLEHVRPEILGHGAERLLDRQKLWVALAMAVSDLLEQGQQTGCLALYKLVVFLHDVVRKGGETSIPPAFGLWRAQRRGMPVIAIVSRLYCERSQAAHSSGKKLVDVADVVIDNHCPPGDCVQEVEGLEWRTGPVSTVTGAMIINMLRCEVAELLVAHGTKPELLPSHQFVGDLSAAEQLERFYEAYRRSLRHLYD